MTDVAELLATAPESAPVQRVRNYYRTDREARPRPLDFLTAIKRTGGAVCLRWVGSGGTRLVRYADPDWECAEYGRFRESGTSREETTVETLDAAREWAWLRTSDGETKSDRETDAPELVAYEEVRAAFEESVSGKAPSEHGNPAIPDGGVAAVDAETTDRPESA